MIDTKTTIKSTATAFTTDVSAGLNAQPKRLPSKYFYDKTGDDLFVQIMNLPEYYVSRAELEIFSRRTETLIHNFDLQKNKHFELVELGAGDGTKTKELLRKLIELNYNFEYIPVDISKNALDQLEADLNSEFESLTVKPKQGDYFEVLEGLRHSSTPKIVLFLGSNIGNMNDQLATEFMNELSYSLVPDDRVLLGMDLIKPKSIVLPAYNDATGITAKFNLNLLRRINRELGGNFDLSKFKHHPEYDETEGIARSFLVATENQSVYIASTGETFHFKAGEKIHTEISRKYNDTIVEQLIEHTEFSITGKILDSNRYFADYILKRH